MTTFMPKTILIVTGTRHGVHGERLATLRREVLDADLIIHGDGSGVDRDARTIARNNDIQDLCAPANWGKHPTDAGPMRNSWMALVAVALKQAGHFVRFAAFPDPTSSGTWDTVNKLKAESIEGTVYQ
jgi:hypothetical protein